MVDNKKKSYKATIPAQSPFVTIKSNQVQEIQWDLTQPDLATKDNTQCKDVVHESSQLFITAALVIAGCGMLIKLFGGTINSIAFDGFRSATVLLVLGLIASCEKNNRIVGRFGYHLGLAAALIFGLNFLRLGYKWFEPSLWWNILPLLAVTMGCSALFAFYKVCRARRDRSGTIFAIGSAVIAVAATLRFNHEQGLSAIDSSYSITIFCLLIPLVIFRYRDSIVEFFREKVEFAPIAVAGLLIVAGAIKVTTTLQPQGATANVIETLLGEDDPAPVEIESEPDQFQEQVQAQ